MKLVIIESPYAGDVEANMAYLQECIRDCLKRGEAPLASHLMYTTALDDTIPEERKLGIEAGFAWGKMADYAVFYVDLGMSKGMVDALERYTKKWDPLLDYEFRRIRGK